MRERERREVDEGAKASLSGHIVTTVESARLCVSLFLGHTANTEGVNEL